MSQRMTAVIDRPFVVFLIGMRINKWWRPDLWLPVAMAMPRMIAELEANPEHGLLGWESGGLGSPSVMIQYWRSSEDLMRYARSQDHEHLPAWSAFRKRVASTDAVGIWHETFVVSPSDYECVYANMPAFGLGKVGSLVPATGHLATARRRLGSGPARTDVAA
ncbi:MAG: DUF4188 domain-containing protein [Sandaracinaceae bacterium]|nr:DUF4188 domain-containing protein [Sandaracinaceae bacterium]